MTVCFISQHGKALISTAFIPPEPHSALETLDVLFVGHRWDIGETTFLACPRLTSLYFDLFLALRIKPDGMLPRSTHGEHVTSQMLTDTGLDVTSSYWNQTLILNLDICLSQAWDPAMSEMPFLWLHNHPVGVSISLGAQTPS